MRLVDDVDDVLEFFLREFLAVEDEPNHFAEGAAEEGVHDGSEVDVGVFLLADGWGIVEFVAFFVATYESFVGQDFQEGGKGGVGRFRFGVLVKDFTCVTTLVWQVPDDVHDLKFSSC